jgi:hypothetical protein
MKTDSRARAIVGDPAVAAEAAERRRDRAGWSAVLLITAIVAITWLPTLNVAFGDSHDGRGFSRHALHVQNFQRDGLLGSHFAADMEPYGPTYAHHPPLTNMLSVLVSSLPGDHEYEIRVGPYLLGLLAIAGAAGLLRAFRVRWVPTLLAVGLMVVTGYFWVYARIVIDLGPLLAMSATVAQVRRHAHPPPWLVAAACASALVATLASWPGMALAAVLGLWLASKRRLDAPVLAIGAAMVVGAAVSLAFVFGVSGATELASQTRTRTSDTSYTVTEFLARQWTWLTSLLPWWYLLLLPVAIVAGLWQRRTRFYVGVTAVMAACWVLGLNNGSYIHDFWAYPVLIPAVVGTGVLLDLAWLRPRPRVATVGALLAAFGLAAGFAGLVAGPAQERYITGPAKAGELVRSHPPAPGQRTAYVVWGIDPPRWVSYYWSLPITRVTLDSVTEADPDNLVVIRVGRVPEWFPDDYERRVVAREGDYALIRVADIRRASGP